MKAIYDPRKCSLYFPRPLVAEMQAEADRMGIPLSRVVQRAWVIARDRLREIPGVPTPPGP